jgi:serine protease Do
VIISPDGYIVTCNHVIADVNKILVRLKNGTEYEAKLIGRDTKTDLAVIKINASGLQAAAFGDSDSLVVGELAVAVGNPLGELGGTVTEGIISALNRDINIDDEVMNLLQTTAAVNPGNSGGALFNSYGELIGVVNSKSGGSNIEGIGFAIPGNTAKSIAEQLVKNGFVVGRVDFGVSLVDINDTWTALRYGLNSLGVYVARDDADSGLKSGDRIVSVNGVKVSSSADVKTVYDKYKVNDVLELLISRAGKEYKANVTLKQAKN